MAGRVEGKVAFITGAGRGMGRSHAVRLAREGADVIALDIAGPLPGIAYQQPTRGMAKAFAAELAKDHVRVNSVHPTGVSTPMGTGDMQAVLGAAIAGNQRLGVMFTNMLPVDGTEPEDVSDLVAFLASDESTFITAHALAPDAGVTEM